MKPSERIHEIKMDLLKKQWSLIGGPAEQSWVAFLTHNLTNPWYDSQALIQYLNEEYEKDCSRSGHKLSDTPVGENSIWYECINCKAIVSK